MFTYRNTVHSTTGLTPAELMFGRTLRSKLDLIRPNVKSVMADNQLKQHKYYGGSKVRELHVGQSVLAKDYRGRSEGWIEGIVIAQLSPVTYTIEIESGVRWKRHLDQLIGLQYNGRVCDDIMDDHITKAT